MHALRESNQDRRYAQLMVGQVFEDVSVEIEDAEFVGAHNAGEQLHH